ncbi:uncharacterized protein ssh2a [Neosynchiropus ocellatus]
MTLGAVSAAAGSPAVSFCSCCGAQMVPCFSSDAVVANNRINQFISESFLTVKGAALFLPRGNSPSPTSAPRISRNKHTGDLQKHLQTMFTVLRPEDTIKLAVRLESAYAQVTRYMVVVSTNGRQDTEESIVLGMDFFSADSCCTVGMVLPLWSDARIHLDGDGGFSVSTVNRVHVFKPVSVQAMWSALQTLYKACEVARCHNYYPGSLFLTWVSYYQSRISSNQFCINEWNAMQDVESHRANSPILFGDLPTERERTERLIRMRLREIMMQKDLENVTSKEIRTELEMQMACNLREFKEFIDNEMIVILGQMDSPTEIFDHVYLGSEWNASNLDELQNSGVRYILNVTREIDNFFPGMFEYHNIRVYDEEATNLLEYWNETYKFITKAKKAGAKCLVHCKMGVSRSASTVIAYAMKEYGWTLDAAFDYVKEKRAVTKPNPSFMKQLEEYQGILLASKQRHNKLWRSHSDSDLSDRPEPMCKASPHVLGRSASHCNNNSSPSLHHFLGVAVLQALGAGPEDSAKDSLANRLCESPGEEEVTSECEDPLLSALPRPKAATLVPEDAVDNAASVAVTVPVPAPHPPPSLHILPPTPELQRAHRGLLTGVCSVHKPLALSPIFSERSSSEEQSPTTPGPADSTSDTAESSLLDTPGEKPLILSDTLPPHASDNNNNPSETDARGEGDGSSSHSSDSIDFFRAREKFLVLAPEVGCRGQQRSESLDSEDRELEVMDQDESGTDTSQSEVCEDQSSPQRAQDNGISVRHIVTEIEAISHPVSSPASPPSPPSPCHLVKAEPEGEGPRGCPTPPSHPPSPSMLPSDWPAGSVRRATEQLELKLRQEMEMSQRSPLHSPSAEHPPLRLSLSSEHPPQSSSEQRDTQGEEASAKLRDPRRQAECQRLGGSDSIPNSSNLISHFSAAEPVTVHTSLESHKLTVEPTVDTSVISGSQPSPSRPGVISLGGVTATDSDTDAHRGSGGCSSSCDAQKRLTRSSLELERVQQTLRELQAFLHEGVSLETPAAEDPGKEKPRGSRDSMDTEPEACKGSDRRLREGKSFLESEGWRRAVELEARLRQAGLTPPSHMKRSASLAKLDCLKLSAHDLSDLDLSPLNRTTSVDSPDSLAASPTHQDDSWKKQKVFPQRGGPPPEDSPSPHHSTRDEKGEREEPDGGGTLAALPRQQGRGHSRRSRKSSAEKKLRAACASYNTM